MNFEMKKRKIFRIRYLCFTLLFEYHTEIILNFSCKYVLFFIKKIIHLTAVYYCTRIPLIFYFIEGFNRAKSRERDSGESETKNAYKLNSAAM